MEPTVAHGEPTTTKHDGEAPTTMETTCTDTSTVSGGCTDEPSEKEALVEKNGSFDFDTKQGLESVQATDENLNGSISQEENRSPETEAVRDKDPTTESNDVIEGYDLEKVMKKQKSHRLICPHCKKKITRTVVLVKRRRRKIHGGGGGEMPPISKTPVGEPTEIVDSASDDDDPVPVPGDDQDSDKKPGYGIKPSSPASNDEEEKSEGKEKVDPNPVPTSYVSVNDEKLKIPVGDVRQWFCSVSPLRFLYIFPSLFLSVFALWFLSTSPPQFSSISLPRFPSISTEQFSSTSSPWLLPISAMLFLAVLAMWFHFSPDRSVETDGKKVGLNSSAPTKVGVNNERAETPPIKRTEDGLASGDDELVAGPDRDFREKPGKNDEPSTFSEDDERSRLPNGGGAPIHSPSHANAATKEEKHHLEPPKQESLPPQEPKPDFATEKGPAKAKETTDPNSTPKHNTKAEEIPINSLEKGGDKIEILKSIVYGGLIESITSLGIVSSAAGSGASTLNILVMGMANLGSGIMLIVHNLLELKAQKPRREEEEDRYEQLIGRREKFRLHIFVVILSFIVFGVIPPLVYGLSFRKTDKRQNKAAAVLVVSLICVVALAIAKAHVARTREYLKTVFGYTKLAIGASGISYIVGDFVSDLLQKYGFYDDSSELRRG